MLKKMKPLTNLAKKVRVIDDVNPYYQEHSCKQSLLVKQCEEGLSPTKSPIGYFAVYVGEERERFVVPMSFLSHPLFKILLEKAYDEFGFDQRNGLVVPCSVSTFHEVVNAVESNNGRFDMRKLFEEFV